MPRRLIQILTILDQSSFLDPQPLHVLPQSRRRQPPRLPQDSSPAFRQFSASCPLVERYSPLLQTPKTIQIVGPCTSYHLYTLAATEILLNDRFLILLSL